MTNYIMTKLVEMYHEEFVNNFPKIMAYISKFIDDRLIWLSSKNILKRVIVTKADIQRFYDIVGVDPKAVDQVIADSPNLDHGIPDQIETVYNLAMVLSCFYEANLKEIQKKFNTKLDPAKFVRMFLIIRIYSICQRQMVPFDPGDGKPLDAPQYSTYNYTIENLNAKFDIVKYPNIYTILEKYVETNNSALEANLKNIDDMDIYLWNSKLIRRVKSMIGKIFNQYLIDREDGKGIVVEQLEATNEEGDTFAIISANVSNSIDTISKKVLNNFVQDTNINTNLLKIACQKANNISQQRVRQILETVKNSSDVSNLMNIIRGILSYWLISLQNQPKTINSKDFILKCSKAYSISNTHDKFVLSIKDELQKIVDKYGAEYVKTMKLTSINNLKQAIYLYVMFYITINN